MHSENKDILFVSTHINGQCISLYNTFCRDMIHLLM